MPLLLATGPGRGSASKVLVIAVTSMLCGMLVRRGLLIMLMLGFRVVGVGVCVGGFESLAFLLGSHTPFLARRDGCFKLDQLMVDERRRSILELDLTDRNLRVFLGEAVSRSENRWEIWVENATGTTGLVEVLVADLFYARKCLDNFAHEPYVVHVVK